MGPFLKIAAASLALALSTTSAQAQDKKSVESFYKGKTITILNAFDSGGYGALTRLAAQYLPKYIPGTPLGSAQFKPGAGGTLQANYLYNIAPRDGTVLGLMYDGTPTTQVTEPENVKFDARKFITLGYLNKGLTGVLGVLKSAGIKTLADAKTIQAIFGATSVNSLQYIVPHIVNQTIGTKFKLIQGYKGAPEIFLAMEKGELNAIFVNYTTIAQQRPQWISEGRITWLGQLADKPLPELGSVPLLQDLPKNPIDKEVLKFLVLGRDPGKIYIAPPGVPEARVTALREAFVAMVKDPEFAAQMRKMKEPLDPGTWQEARNIIEKTVDTKPEVIARLQYLSQARK